jgi:hypothetical protein
VGTPAGTVSRGVGGRRTLLVLAIALVLGGCASLLPASRKAVVSEWTSYDHASASLAALQPFKATRTDVHGAGLDPASNPAVTVLHFGDVLQRFAAAAMIRPDDVERGIRDCLFAGRRCNAYAISVKKTERRRVGNFWLDSFGFHRETITSGWGVEALFVFVDDRLVYQLVGGQPTIREVEVQRNPLGPLQSWGDNLVQGSR